MRVYYAHAMVLYGTDIEKAELAMIRAHFPQHEIVDPGEHESNPEKSKQQMQYCARLIDGCDALVFSKLLGKITSGVGWEVNYAHSKYKPVYCLEGKELIRVTKPISYLSREDTLKHYEFWRNITGRMKAMGG